jgi:SAM-dependent methyltransferase
MADHQFEAAELAELYDAFNTDRSDLAFYLPLLLAARSVLDVGCGTGELLRSARAAGHTGRLTGLDPASAMLDVARRREPSVEWVLGTLGEVTFRREFDLVVMTGHAFQVLLTDAELREFLAATREALHDGGRFAFETRNPLVRAWEQWIPGNVREITTADGMVVTQTHQVTAPDGDLVRFSSTYDSAGWAEPHVNRSTLRFLGADALETFLSEAGLAVEATYGDWDGSPLSETSPDIITVARRV